MDMMIKKLGRLVLMVCTLSCTFAMSSVIAATFYVRTGATGANSGADWNNAWTQFSSINYAALNPGDTVYIAGGTYGPLGVAKSGAPGQPITFKRATAAEHGTSTGWSNAYDTRVTIDGGRNRAAVGIGETTYSAQHHITVDGATRYGIWIRNAYYGVRAAYGSNNLTLRNLEIGDAGAGRLDEDGIQGKGDNLIVEYCNIHDNDSQITHGDGIQWFGGNSVILRYNIFKNNGQQIYLGEGAWDSVVNDAQIYYNIVYNRGGGHYNGIVLYGNASQAGRFINVYNNTFDLEATADDGYNSLFYPLRGNATVNFKNNAVVHANTNQVPNTNHSNNAYDNVAPYVTWNIPAETSRVVAADLGFVDIASANYRPSTASPLIGKGTNVGLKFDFDGKAVGSTPSIGAFEGGSASAAPAPAPAALAAPTGLAVR
jgi:hypothetical protein